MRITTNHSASCFGAPVILGDDGQPLDYAPGVRAVRKRLGLPNTAALGELVGYTARTVESWEQGRRPVPADALNVMAQLLRKARQPAPKRP